MRNTGQEGANATEDDARNEIEGIGAVCEAENKTAVMGLEHVDVRKDENSMEVDNGSEILKSQLSIDSVVTEKEEGKTEVLEEMETQVARSRKRKANELEGSADDLGSEDLHSEESDMPSLLDERSPASLDVAPHLLGKDAWSLGTAHASEEFGELKLLTL